KPANFCSRTYKLNSPKVNSIFRRYMNSAVSLKLLRAGKSCLLITACCCSLAGIIFFLQSFSFPAKKDFWRGYLLAKAMVHGVYPYLPLPELGEIWLPEHPVTDLVHPTPHPFAVGWLCLPLTVLSYKHATIAWLLLQLGCLMLSVVLLSRILG